MVYDSVGPLLGALCVSAVNFARILREAAVARDLTPVPWLGNRRVRFERRYPGQLWNR